MLHRTRRLLKLSHHKHTGKGLPHTATSHGLLLILVLLSGVFLFFATRGALAVSESGSLNLNGVIKAPAPSVAAVIQQPQTDQEFTDSPIRVSGSCPVGTFVQLFNNQIYAGSTRCDGGRFELEIGLFVGQNELIAKVFDNLFQFGPDSAPVTVTYRLKPTQALPRGVPQLYITTDSQYQGAKAGQKLDLNIHVSGGKPSYAVLIRWGDGTEEMWARNESGTFSVSHTYEHGGVYDLVLQVTDNSGHKASFGGILLVHGVLKSGGGPITPESSEVPPAILISWPLYIIALYCVIFFWVGEKYELYKLKKAHQLKAN